MNKINSTFITAFFVILLFTLVIVYRDKPQVRLKKCIDGIYYHTSSNTLALAIDKETLQPIKCEGKVEN